MLDTTISLLGSTIRFDENDWSAPSAIPGWSRAHIAAHLAANANAIRNIVAASVAGREVMLYESPQAKSIAIELGSTRDPLSLQIDLDTSASQLASIFHDMPYNVLDKELQLTQRLRLPAPLLPLVRLSEIILHRWDLRAGHDLTDVDDEPVLWCLELRANILVGDPNYPAFRLVTPEGLDITIGRVGNPETVRGDIRTLLGWLTGRSTGSNDPNNPLSRPLRPYSVL